MEGLVRWLSHSRHRVLDAFFGLQSVRRDLGPARTEALIRRVERGVYGAEGLAGYEGRRPPPLAQLARRSLAQYLCQRALIRRRPVRVMLDLLFGLGLPVLGLVLLARTLAGVRRVEREPSDVVILDFSASLRRIAEPAFPGRRIVYRTTSGMRFGIREAGFLVRVVAACPRLALYPGLMANLLRWLGYFAATVYLHRPAVVAGFFEGTCSSSLMTAYLREAGVRHVNLMHGERFLFAGNAFCEFDEFHVWGTYFADQFAAQRSPAGRFRITGNSFHRALYRTVRTAGHPRPRRLMIFHGPFLEPGSAHFDSLVRVLRRLGPEWEMMFRSHRTDRGRACFDALREEVRVRGAGWRILDPPEPEADLAEALRGSRVTVGVYSTAMLEAWIAGCKVIHLVGTGWAGPDLFFDRYGKSPNVLYGDDAEDVDRFLASPVVLDEAETRRIHHVTRVLGTEFPT